MVRRPKPRKVYKRQFDWAAWYLPCSTLFRSSSRIDPAKHAIRQSNSGPRLTSAHHDRAAAVSLVSINRQVLTIIRPETLVRWHRAGFRCSWRWRSRPLGGRPQIETDLRALIRRMSVDNPLWGAPRIHGELLKLGFAGAQSSVAKYMVKRRGPPSQGWRTFLRNHAPDIAAMDLF